MKSLIKTLVEIPGPSGYESQIRQTIADIIKPLVDHLEVDNLGNIIARIDSLSDNPKRLMLSAHMDEIGVIATHIDSNGFIRFTNIGGVRPETCLGGHVRFLNGTQGVIGTESINTNKENLSLEKMYIDIGIQEKEQAPVRIGDVACFERPFIDLGKRLVSKAMDDRISVAIMIGTLRAIKEKGIKPFHQTFFVFSTQEEVGLRGATTAAFGLNPDIGLSLDVTASGDTPKGNRMEVGLGKGPAIKVRDSGMLSDPRIVDWMVKTAETSQLPFQLEVLERGTTDARAIQLARAGVPVGCLSIPCRYIHSPSEMVDMEDIENSIRLLIALLQQPVQLNF
jgi:tetrahedral aminopeptidase